jgi:hypothetical protein
MTQDRAGEVGEEALNEVEPRAALDCEGELEPVSRSSMVCFNMCAESLSRIQFDLLIFGCTMQLVSAHCPRCRDGGPRGVDESIQQLGMPTINRWDDAPRRAPTPRRNRREKHTSQHRVSRPLMRNHIVQVNAKEHDDEKPSCAARKLRCKRGHLSITASSLQGKSSSSDGLAAHQ